MLSTGILVFNKLELRKKRNCYGQGSLLLYKAQAVDYHYHKIQRKNLWFDLGSLKIV